MFSIPELSGELLLNSSPDLSVKVYPNEVSYVPQKQKTGLVKWGTYLLFRSDWTIKEWFKVHPFESIENHAFTEHQILYFLNRGLPLLPKHNAIFITKDRFLTNISRSRGGRNTAPPDETYYAEHNSIDVEHWHLFNGEEATLFFLM